ncbi:MAG: hypothetical protein LBO72_05985 [Helicobacteraceae bacterium]|jgi:hypothetical protein|nr:hypothetical protein [Helicobacteraceae bacterium]
MRKFITSVWFRRCIAIAIAPFVIAILADVYFSRTIGGGWKTADSFNGKFPVFMHPHWKDTEPDIETLNYKESFFRSFSESGTIRFYVKKFKQAQNGRADGITLEIYADGKLIASKYENPYADASAPFADDNEFRAITFDFAIPNDTKEIVIKTTPNANTDVDHVMIDRVKITRTNYVGTLVFGVLTICFIWLLSLEFIRQNVAAKTKIWLRRAYENLSKMPAPIKIFVALSIFLLCYVRYNINLAPLILVWAIWKLSAYEWLANLFGERQTKLAIWIAAISALFFVAIVLFLRVPIVMDVLLGDQNRVFGDFTMMNGNHYRAKTHPFYVLIWQSVYHLFSPLVTHSSLSIRIMIALFAGLNVGLFSLFASRALSSATLNAILCAIFAFSFPQIYHGGQMMESFIFTQTAILLSILYFSFAFQKKEYNLWALLILALFVVGNNIAYICIFGVFYLILLFSVYKKWKEICQKALMFALYFLIAFCVILYLQSFFYGHNSPSNIVSLYKALALKRGATLRRI